MQRGQIGSAVAILAVLAGWTGAPGWPNSQQTPPPATKTPTNEASNQEINDSFVQRISKQISGHEQEPAGKVFKNIQFELFKKTPASRLLLIMKVGYSRALGVKCTYCHVEEDFSKDDKRPKRAAREMAAMHYSINQQLLKMQNLEPNPQGHFINCETCHRGAVDPMKQ